jgi:hypothetical protein
MRKSLHAIICAALIGILAWSSPVLAQQKTAKACQDEWRANRADNQAKGITEKAYVAECRAGGATAQPQVTPPPAVAPAAKSTAAPAPATKPTPAAATSAAGANQFSTEAQAKARCPSDTVVWVNTPSKIYHFSGYKDYGNTKSGAYMCEKDTAPGGFRAAKNEKHP